MSNAFNLSQLANNTNSTGQVSLTAGVTGTLPIANGGTNLTSAGTSGYIMSSNGTSFVMAAPAGGAAFPSGTRMSFQQTSAPTGWTKDTTAAINDSILRFVTGTASSGGTTAFSTWNAQTSSGATTLTTAQIPSHTHSYTYYTASGSGSIGAGPYKSTRGITGVDNSANSGTTGTQGSGSSHTHSLTQSLKYYDFIIASAN